VRKPTFVADKPLLASASRPFKLATGIVQISARTPACTAMTAMTIDHLSGGRLILGLGVSGPQVVEGWYGQSFPKPMARMREYITLLRTMLKREGPVTFEGEHYQLPLRGGSGLGKPLKLITHPTHAVPIHLAALGPRNVALAAEIADGWLPVFYSPFRGPAVFQPLLDEGFAASGEPEKADRFEVIPALDVRVTADVAGGLAAAKPMLALYLGGMGAKGRNFYNDLVKRYGYEAEAEAIQDLYLEGKKDEAAALIPDALLEGTTLCGSEGYVKERLAAYKESGVTVLNVTPVGPDPVKLIEQVKTWIDDI
jgi:F420-dependent oxidoreductase-like protein